MTPDIRSDLRNLQDFEFSDSANGLPKWRVTELNKLIVHQSRSILKSKKYICLPINLKRKILKINSSSMKKSVSIIDTDFKLM